MATLRDVLGQLQTIVEAVTPDSPRYDAAPAFRLTSAFDPEHVTTHQSVSRRFVVSLTGTRRAVGPMGAVGTPIDIEQTVDLTVLYRQPSDAFEVFRVIAEDVDRLAWALMQPAKWDQATTGAMVAAVGSYSAILDDAGPNGVALVSIPITIRYRPSFTG